MTFTTLTTSSGPYTAVAQTTFAVTFFSTGASEIEVTLDGVVVSPNLYVFTRDDDGTGEVVFTTAVTGTVVIYSKPVFSQPTSFSRFGAFYPDQFNLPLDKAAARDLYLKSRVDLLFSDDMRTTANRAGKYAAWDAGGLPVPSSGTGADAGLRVDLAGIAGSALVGYQQSLLANVKTVQKVLRRWVFADDYMDPGNTGAQNVAGWANLVTAIGSDAAKIIFGAGTYQFDDDITPPANAGIAGQGHEATYLRFTGATDGIVIPSGFRRLHLENFTIETSNAGAGKALSISQGSRGFVSNVHIGFAAATAGRWAFGLWAHNWQTTKFYNFRCAYAATTALRFEYGCNCLDFFGGEAIGFNTSPAFERGIDMTITSSLGAGTDQFEITFYGFTIQGHWTKSCVRATGATPIMVGGHIENTDAAPDDGADVFLDGTGSGIVNAKFSHLQGGSFLTAGTLRNFQISMSEVAGVTCATGCQAGGISNSRFASFTDADGHMTVHNCSNNIGQPVANKVAATEHEFTVAGTTAGKIGSYGVLVPAVAVAALPAAAAGNRGARHTVTDSNAAFTAGIGAIVAAGGANIVPVFSDGTNWRIG